MRCLRAICVGVLLWILVFVEVSIFQIGLQLTGLFGKVLHYFLLIPISVLGAWVYYKSGDELNGFLLGFLMLLVGIVLDLLVTVPFFVNGDFKGYYYDPFLWTGFLVAVVVVGTYDLSKKK
ncbi:MAG: DUF5367 family protein [Candidatus Heimdallarchaeaceae archaeon]